MRFALTSEAGLNDGLAFPFVYAAVFLASLGPCRGGSAGGSPGSSSARWSSGWPSGPGSAGPWPGSPSGAPSKPLRLAEQGEPLLAIAALVMTYGLSELVGGYGFLAVFACGMALRAGASSHRYHEAMHSVIERLERLLTLIILLLLGMAMTHGLLANLDWRSFVIVGLLIFVVRPLAGIVSLRTRRRDVERRGGLSKAEAVAVAFFGVRGIGSIYYLAYAAGEHAFIEERFLWSTVALAITVSVFVHGVLVTPVMGRLDARRGLTGTSTSS